MRQLIQKVSFVFLTCLFVTHTFGKDIIVTKQNQKYQGTVIDKNSKGFVLRKFDGSMVVVPSGNISRILRNEIVYDFDEGMKYRLRIRRPFLPFAVLGVATGVFAIKSYGDYQDERERAKSVTPVDIQYTGDKSKTYLAYSIVSGLFSIGSFYIAFRPFEVKVPMGRIKLGTTSHGVEVALHF